MSNILRYSIGPAAIVGVGFVLILLVEMQQGKPPRGPTPGRFQTNTCFTPAEDCEKLLLQTIQLAEKELLVQAYSFTSRRIANALAEAARRGVIVRVLADGRQAAKEKERAGVEPILRAAGIELIFDSCCAIAHNKVMIIDFGEAVVTGSYNWTDSAARRNAENMLILGNPDRNRVEEWSIGRRYRENWLQHAAAAAPGLSGGAPGNTP